VENRSRCEVSEVKKREGKENVDRLNMASKENSKPESEVTKEAGKQDVTRSRLAEEKIQRQGSERFSVVVIKAGG
jgi:hypothetical protein